MITMSILITLSINEGLGKDAEIIKVIKKII